MFRFIREKVEGQTFELINTPTDQLVADVLRKELPQVKVEQHRWMLMGQSRFFLPIRKNLSGGVRKI